MQRRERERDRDSTDNSACHVQISCVAMKFRILTATQISGGKCGLGSLVVMYSLSASQCNAAVLRKFVCRRPYIVIWDVQNNSFTMLHLSLHCS